MISCFKIFIERNFKSEHVMIARDKQRLINFINYHKHRFDPGCLTKKKNEKKKEKKERTKENFDKRSQRLMA